MDLSNVNKLQRIIVDIDNTLWDFASVFQERLRKIAPAIPPMAEWKWDFYIDYISIEELYIACLKWEKEEYGAKPSTSEIWWRFPKFVLGFFVASVIITVIASGYTMQDYDKIVKLELIKPIMNLRSWTFIFCFLSIGLTTRFRELAAAGKKPFSAFTIGVAVNVILGFVLSVLILGNYWINAVK